MDLLNNFTEMDMIEQIVTLEDLKSAKDPAAITPLMEVYAVANDDQAVDEMVYHALYELLEGQETATVKGLDHPSDRVQIACVRRAGHDTPASAYQPLLELLKKRQEPEFLSEVIRALGSYKKDELRDILMPYISHADATVVAWAMGALSSMGDTKVRDALIGMVNKSKSLLSGASDCDLAVAIAVDNIARFEDKTSIDFVVGHIHHANPMFRRVIMNAMLSMGESVFPALEGVLEHGDKDEKIMAANVIGFMGNKSGADVLLSALEKAVDLNLRFAIYEALGRITSMRSVIGLTDGLVEEDEMVLMAVITGLDHQCNPGVVKKVLEHLAAEGGHADLLIRNIITARAANLFTAVYKNGEQAEKLMQALLKSDAETIGFFRYVLSGIETADNDLERLVGAGEMDLAKKILAADDSKAMLFFYKGAEVDLGLEMVTVADGKDALEYLLAGHEIEILVTDMNMPDMDGIELTKQLRSHKKWQKLPILMASTESESSQKELATQAGVTDFITKPFNKETFVQKVRSILG